MWSPERQAGPSRVVGQAYTVEYAPLADERPKVEGHYVSSRVTFHPSYRPIERPHYGFGTMRLRAVISRNDRRNADMIEIDNIPRGSVVFIKGPRDVPNALYGGLMSMRARTSGAVGTIVDGSIRDLQEHRDLGYPVSWHFCHFILSWVIHPIAFR